MEYCTHIMFQITYNILDIFSYLFELFDKKDKI